MRQRRLVVNADDFGLHAGLNAGVIQAHCDGIVTSASLSSNGAAFEDAVRLAREVPALSVGLHLTLVGEAALSPSGSLPTLAPDGRLPAQFASLFRRMLFGQVRRPEIERELTTQVERALDAGVRISHLDSHQHVHLHPRLVDIVLRLALRFGIPAVRAAHELFPARGLRPALLSVFSRRGARRLRAAGLHTADACVGLAETGALGEAELLRLVARLPEGTTELVCHPGIDAAAIGRTYPWGFRWDEETAALTSPRVKAALAEGGVDLVSYREVGTAR